MSPQESTKQAHINANEYMTHAVADIDAEFGAGYAKAHPELVGAYMQTAAIDFLSNFGLERISGALSDIGDTLIK